MKKKISLFLVTIMLLNVMSNLNVDFIVNSIVKVKADTNKVLSKSYGELTQEDKEYLLEKYNIGEGELLEGINLGLSLSKLTEIERYNDLYSLSYEDSKTLSEFEKDKKNSIINSLNMIKAYIFNQEISNLEREAIIQLALQGYSGEKINGSIIISKSIGCGISELLDRDNNNEVELSNIKDKLTKEEFIAFKWIVTDLKIDALNFYNYCITNSIEINNITIASIGKDEEELLFEVNGSDNEENINSKNINLMSVVKSENYKNSINSLRSMDNSGMGNGIPSDMIYAPFTMKSGENEQIGLSRGDLRVNLPVYSLAGKGLDLNINLMFDSGEARTRENIYKIEYHGYVEYAFFYDVSYRDENNKLVKLGSHRVFAQSKYQAEKYLKNRYRDKKINTVYLNHTVYNRLHWCNYFDDFIEMKDSEKRNGLGMGWGLNFPYIKVHPKRADEKTLHFADGQEFSIYLEEGFEYVNSTGLIGYPKRDLEIRHYYEKFEGAQVKPNYVLKYKDGTEQFFAEDGRFLGMRDRYGNKIIVESMLIDGIPRVSKVIDSLNRVITIDYNNTTRKSTIRGAKEVVMNLPDGNKIQFVLEPIQGGHHKLTKVIDQLNRETSFVYSNVTPIKESVSTKITSKTDNALINLNEIRYYTGAKTKYKYEKADSDNTNLGIVEFYRVTKREDADKRNISTNILSYSYNGKHTDDKYTRKTTDGKGIATEYEFNDKHLVKSSTVKDGNKKIRETINEYDTYDQIRKVSTKIYDMNGSKYRSVQNTSEYDYYGDLIKTIDERGIITTYEYNDLFHVLKKSDIFGENGSVTVENIIDNNNGNIKSTTIKNGSTVKSKTSYKYYTSGYQKNQLEKEWTTVDKGKQSEISYEYGNQYKGAYVTKTTVKARSYNNNRALINTNSITEYIYDFNRGLLKEEIKKSSVGDIRIKYSHDKIGRTTKVLNVNTGTYKIIGFDDVNNIIVDTMENGNMTRTLYDSFGREEKNQVYRDSRWVTLSTTVYNSLGEVDYVLDGNNNKTSFRYDKLGRVIETTLPNGAKTTNQYNDYENSILSTDAVGRKAKEIKDISGNVIKTRVYPNKNNTNSYYEITNQYDKESNLKVVTDAKGYKTYYDYDVYGRLIKVKNNENRVMTVYDYDGRDNVIKINTLDGMTITKEYDELGRLMRETNSLNQSEYIGYNEAGQVRYKWDKAGNISTFSYDKMGRVTNETHSDGPISYGYNFSRGTSVDTKTITKNGNTSTFEYYKYGPLKKKTEGGKAISYTYDIMGNTKTVYDQSSKTTTYNYNNMNLLESVVTGEGTTKYTYYPDGKIMTKITGGNDNVAEDYIYNDLGMVTEQRHYLNGAMTKKYSYEYDKNGNKSKETESGGGITKVTTYAYDSLNRVDYTIEPDGTKIKYEYDGRSNIRYKRYTMGGFERRTEEYNYDSMNKLINKTETKNIEMLEVDVQENYTYNNSKLSMKVKVEMSSKDIKKFKLSENAYEELTLYIKGNTGLKARKVSNKEFVIDNIDPNKLANGITYGVKLGEMDIKTISVSKYQLTGALEAIYASVKETPSYSGEIGNLTVNINLRSKNTNIITVTDSLYESLNIEIEALKGARVRKLSKDKFIIENINFRELNKDSKYKIKIGNVVIQEEIIKASHYMKDLEIIVTKDWGDVYYLKATAKYKNGNNVSEAVLKNVTWRKNDFTQIGSLDKKTGATNVFRISTGSSASMAYSMSSFIDIGDIVFPPSGGWPPSKNTTVVGISAKYNGLSASKGFEVEIPNNNGNELPGVIDIPGMGYPNGGGSSYSMFRMNDIPYKAEKLNTTTSSALEIEKLNTTTGAALETNILNTTTGSTLKVEKIKTTSPVYEPKILNTTTGSAFNFKVKIRDISPEEIELYKEINEPLKMNKSMLMFEESKMMLKTASLKSSHNKIFVWKYEYHYDGNGNIIREYTNKALTKTYTYNSLNQLTRVNDIKNKINATYTYYPTGLRKSKTVTGTPNPELNGTINFHYSGDNVIMEEKGGSYLSRYTIGLGYIRRIDSRNNKYYYLYDSHGDVTIIVDANGRVVKSYDYDIYGKEQDTGADGQAIYNPIRYSGQFFDEESGLYYLRARYYSPAIMRFVSEDTYKGDIRNQLSLNYYLYCLSNPVMMYDSSGNWPKWSKLGVGLLKVAGGVLTVAGAVVAAPVVGTVGGIIVAGAATCGLIQGMMGSAEVIESFTGDNVIRDDLMAGNEALYNTVDIATGIGSAGGDVYIANTISKAMYAGSTSVRIASEGAGNSSSNVDELVDLMKNGKITSDGRNIINQIDDNTQILFRMDVGEHAHEISTYGYPNPTNHINIEIQVKNAKGKWSPKWDFHMILDDLGEITDKFITGRWKNK